MALEIRTSGRSIRSRVGPIPGSNHIPVLSGAIFMCNRRTKKECLDLLLFGLPRSNIALVQQIVPGMKLFLFEFERRELWGVFEATSYGAMDIIPNAYSGRPFPCQVRVKPIGEYFCLKEEEFCEAIRGNYYEKHKFHMHLTVDQVSNLCRLFLKRYTTEIYPDVHLVQGDEYCIPNRCSLGLDGGLVGSQLVSYTNNGMSMQIRGNESLVSNDRSVWSRISEGPTSTTGIYHGEEMKNMSLDLASICYSTTGTILPSSENVPNEPSKKVKLAVADDSGSHCRTELLMEDCSSREEFAVRFKRRRSDRNHNKECIDQPPGKLRRKLSRPSFDICKVPLEPMEPETADLSLNSVITDVNAKARVAEIYAIHPFSECKDSDQIQPSDLEDQSLQSSSANGNMGSQTLVVATASIQESNESNKNHTLALKSSLRNEVARDYRPSGNHGFMEGNSLGAEDLPMAALKGTFCNDWVESKHPHTEEKVMESEVSTLYSDLASEGVNHSSELAGEFVTEKLTISREMPSRFEILPKAHNTDDESVCTQLALGMPIHSLNHGNVEVKSQQSQSYQELVIDGELLSLAQPVCSQAPETEGNTAHGIPVSLVDTNDTDNVLWWIENVRSMSSAPSAQTNTEWYVSRCLFPWQS